jgi:hypothetical protein
VILRIILGEVLCKNFETECKKRRHLSHLAGQFANPINKKNKNIPPAIDDKFKPVRYGQGIWLSRKGFDLRTSLHALPTS